MEKGKKRILLDRFEKAKELRNSWYPTWKECSYYSDPPSGNFDLDDRFALKGRRTYADIVDSVAIDAKNIFASGIMNIASSSSRPWLKLQTQDPDLAERQDIKIWLQEETDAMHRMISSSSIYNTLDHIYRDLFTFGTSCSFILPNFYKVIYTRDVNVGEFCLSSNEYGDIDRIYREYQCTVLEAVKQFGLSNCSNYVKNMYDQGRYDNTINVCHIIEPNENYDENSVLAKRFKYKSVYFESNSSEDSFLEESGFRSFPCVTPRWLTKPDMVYGISPVMAAIPDIKTLQRMAKDRSIASAFMASPPLQGASEIQGIEDRIYPSSYIATNQINPIQPLFQPNVNLNDLRMDMLELRARLQNILFVPLFSQLGTNLQDKTMTAYEVAQRNQEALSIIAPMSQRLHTECLKPLCQLVFEYRLSAGLTQPVPNDLAGQNIEIEFVSVLAQAQVASKLNNIDRFAITLGQLLPVAQATQGKIDIDRAIDVISDSAGVDPSLIVGNDQVALIRQNVARQQQQAQQAALAQQVAQTAQTLSQTPTNNNSALSEISNAFAGF